MELFQNKPNIQETQTTTGEQEDQNIFLKPIETFHCAPDDSKYKGERIDTYFEEVVSILNYSDRAKKTFLNIEYKTAYFEDDIEGKLFSTNDRIGYLTAHAALIAFTLETRTEFDFIDVTMVCTLTPKLLSLLQRNEAQLEKK